jgi:hypothetical protein
MYFARGTRAGKRRVNDAPGFTWGAETETAVAREGWRAMWQHQEGRIDFDEPLFELMRRGWWFRENAPISGAGDGRCWEVIAAAGGARVRVDRLERRDAWAEAVRLALLAVVERRPLPAPRLARATGGSPGDPTVCDEERARLKNEGWSFSEHATAQASGLKGWVVSGNRGELRIRTVDDDRSDAWGEALILAAVMGTVAGPGPA